MKFKNIPFYLFMWVFVCVCLFAFLVSTENVEKQIPLMWTYKWQEIPSRS